MGATGAAGAGRGAAAGAATGGTGREARGKRTAGAVADPANIGFAGAGAGPCATASANAWKNSPAIFFAVEFDQPSAELRELAADMGVDDVVQQRRARAFGRKRHRRAAIGEAGDAARAFADDAVTVRRVEVGERHLAGESRLDRSDLDHDHAVHLGRRNHLEALATRDARLQDRRVVEGGPDLGLRRGHPLRFVHLHANVP